MVVSLAEMLEKTKRNLEAYEEIIDRQLELRFRSANDSVYVTFIDELPETVLRQLADIYTRVGWNVVISPVSYCMRGERSGGGLTFSKPA